MDLKDHGGSASIAMRYSIQPRFARARIVIRSQDTAGSVDMIDVRCAVCGKRYPVENDKLRMAPMLTFFRARANDRYDVDVWICDVHWSDGSLSSPSM